VVEDLSVVVSYDEIKKKNYSLSAGQYFEVKIEYIDITEDEFNSKMGEFKKDLEELFKSSRELEEEILKNFGELRFG
jgi:type I restriction enzyme M protein